MSSVFFEMKRLGAIIRVSAMDEVTGIEAVIQGSAHASKKELEAVALSKLRYIIEKRKREAREQGSS